MKVREDLSAQDLYDAAIRFIDLLRVSTPLPGQSDQRTAVLTQVEVFLNALVEPDQKVAA